MPFPAILAEAAQGLRAGPLHLSMFVALPGAEMVEHLAAGPLDSVVLDMQHGMWSDGTVAAGIGAAALAGKPALVRLPVEAGGLASRVADFGAAGVICPMVEDAATAAAVALMRYPPLGSRSWGPRRGLSLTGLSASEYLRQSNDLLIVLAMIETRRGLERLDEILATPGLDGVFVGPSDLAISLSGGVGLTFAEVPEAAARVAGAARAAGRIAGIFAPSLADARAARAQGFGFIALGTETGLIAAAAADLVTAAREG